MKSVRTPGWRTWYASARIVLALAPVISGLSAADTVSFAGPRADLLFEPNRGQTSDAVRYLAHSADGVFFFTADGVIVSGKNGAAGFELAGANRAAEWEVLEPTGRTISYRIGRDHTRWVEGVPRYERLVRHQVYPGIDLIYYGNGNRLEYDFRVAAGADISAIRLRFSGAKRLSIAPDGALAIEMPEGTVRQERPRLYETLSDGSRREIPGEFVVLDTEEAGFRVTGHDSTRVLSIDPVLDSATYLGGNGDDSVIYVNGSVTVGNTTSIDFPGASFGRPNGNSVFINSGGQTQIYGATGNVVATSAAGGEGYVVVGGYTDARDLPTSVEPSIGVPAAWQPDFAGGETDGFLLLGSWLTYAGTSRDDRIEGVTLYDGYFAAVGDTNGRGLPSSVAPSFVGVPADYAAGFDGFLLTGLASSDYLVSATYFGGSGEDWPLAVYASFYGTYVAGETLSQDFPVTNGSTLHGLSDAFLMRFPPPYYGSTGTPSALLYGGSGADRATAIAGLSNGAVLVAGTTASPDLPLQNPAQAAYGGGASDAFLAFFAPDLSAVTYATYIGGSGGDEAMSVATDSNTSVFVGGSTASVDFPLRNPSQPIFGGGRTDGFLTRYDLSGNIQDATYFGGSGNDTILGLYAAGGSSVVAGGQTSSANLPLVNATQSSLNGSSNGFVAQFSSALIIAPAVVDGKDLRTYGSLYVGDAAMAASAVVTVTSSDPSTVQVAANQGDPGAGSIQVPASSRQQYFVDCLQDSGGANLTLSSPGYPDAVAPVTCFPAGIEGEVEIYQGEVWEGTWLTSPVTVQNGTSAVVYFSMAVQAPSGASGLILGPRPGANPVQITTSNSTPSVGTLDQSAVTIPTVPPIGGYSFASVGFTPVSGGETSLSFTSSGPPVLTPNPLSVIVTALASDAAPGPYPVPSGFQYELPYTYQPFDSGQPLVVSSQDPTRVLLSTGGGQTGSASVSVNGPDAGIWVQAVGASGDVGITFAPPGEAPVSTTVHVAPPAAFFPVASALPQPVSLGVGQSLSISAGVGLIDPQPECCYFPIGSGPTFTLTSSDPQVLTIPNPTLPVNSLSTFTVTGAVPGKTALSIASSSGIPLAPGSGTLSANVSKMAVIFPSIEVGNHLEGVMTLTFPVSVANGTSIQVTTSDPTMALLSNATQSAGQSQIATSTYTANGSTVSSFYVYGMAASGQAQIAATIPGMGTFVANVTLDPSGFGWSTDTLTTTLYQPTGLPFIQAFALDRATMLPVAVQSLQPGLTVTTPISNGNPSIVSLSSSSYTAPNGLLPQLTTLASGVASITIGQPAGFSPPAVRKSLAVTVQVPALIMGLANNNSPDNPIGKNLQTQLGFNNLPNSVDLPLTVTSSDPSLLLISGSPSAVGSASATVSRANWSNVTLQALADSGTVTVTASMPTFNPRTLSVTLAPAGVGLVSSVSPSQNGQYYTTTQSPVTSLGLAIFILDLGQTLQTTSAFRAGLGPVQASITSSNPTVATISNSPVTLNPAQEPSVNLTPVGVGATTLTVSQPAGFDALAGLSPLTFNVTQPSFFTPNWMMAKDTFAQVWVGLNSEVGSLAANLNVTLSSGDPTRLLLSPNATTAPSAAITVVLAAGQSYVTFYAHALGNSGTIPIAVTAPGFTQASTNVQLTDLTFLFGTQYGGVYSSPFTSTLQNGAVTLAVAPIMVSPSTVPSGYNSPDSIVIRPGASITVGIVSSDPAVVSLQTPQIVFTGGMSQGIITFVPQQPGSATLSLEIPAGYTASASGGALVVNVVSASGAK